MTPPIQNNYGWGFISAMKIDRVHKLGILGSGVKIAILDTGIAKHDNINIMGGINTIDQEDKESFEDNHWHGSHVAGIIGAKGKDGIYGVAPEASIFSVKVGKTKNLDSLDFINKSFEKDLHEALLWCLEEKMEVVNLSLHCEPNIELDNLIELSCKQGMIFVAPSGNYNGIITEQSSKIDYPARNPKVISVGAVGKIGTYSPDSIFSNAENGAAWSLKFPDYYVAGFSKKGLQLDFVAPGVAITSIINPNQNGWSPFNEKIKGYTSWMGTSQAAPFITGTIALMLSAIPSLRKLTGNEKVDTVRNLLAQSSVSLGLEKEIQGYGIPFAPACVGV